MKRKFLTPLCVDPGRKRVSLEPPVHSVVFQSKPYITPPSPQLATVKHGTEEPENDDDIYLYKCMYAAKKRNSKGKGPWSDGLLLVKEGRIYEVKTVGGKVVSKRDFIGETKPSTSEGSSIQICNLWVDVMEKVAREDFLRGTMYGSFKATEIKKRPAFECSGSFEESARSISKAEDLRGTICLNSLQIGEETGTVPPVYVDEFLASRLRPHQRDGVQFLYDCITGQKVPGFSGCLLADEMGLGKTVQIVTLLWALLKKGSNGKPVLRKAIVVVPSSLVENWSNEVKKWLGSERLKVLTVKADASPAAVAEKLRSYVHGNVLPLLIISYELLRIHVDLIASVRPDLLVCDEGHRLKNSAGSKTMNAIAELNSPRTILVTGTPIQNNLNEYYALLNFVNPNVLGPLASFKNFYVLPIERAQDRNASKDERELGSARSQELYQITSAFILRRTADLNQKYLPPKQEYVVFARHQPLQMAMYKAFLGSSQVSSLLQSSGVHSRVLTAICTLRKLCNHPSLVCEDEVWDSLLSPENLEDVNVLRQSIQQSNLSSLPSFWDYSGKMGCLCRLLQAVFEQTSGGSTDKVVVISNFTQTLDYVEEMCDAFGWPSVRFDGGTDVSLRQSMVSKFNSTSSSDLVFLLSSKAGGTGLNIIGANRLVLFDPDWNPATDAQAMARVWREGQKKEVFIYRFLATCSIEEKIYQRQMMKCGLAAAVTTGAQVDGGGSSSHCFTKEELKELFSFCEDTQCDTRDLLRHTRVTGQSSWAEQSASVHDQALQEVVDAGLVTFVHQV